MESRTRLPGGALRSAAIAIFLASLTVGCVSSGTHEQVVQDREKLRRELSQAKKSQKGLNNERSKLLEDMENLRQEKEKLEDRIQKLARDRAELENNIQQREQESHAELNSLAGTYDGLVSDLEAEVAAGQIQIERLREGLRLNMAQEILFATGSARLNSAGRSVISTVASRLRELPQRVEVQGHTDAVPIKGALALRYPTNWELAAARASEIVRLLERKGIDPGRMTAVSFGEHRPVSPNDSPDDRARNRRIEIRLLPPDDGR